MERKMLLNPHAVQVVKPWYEYENSCCQNEKTVLLKNYALPEAETTLLF